MTVTVYKSTDASAPALGNTAGSLIALLDAILVNGYGAKSAQGWTKPLTGTNLAAYKQPAGSNQFYLRVDDTSLTVAQVRGYETLTDVTVPSGTNPFPTTAQVALGSGLFVYKANGAARPWIAIGNGKLFYLFLKPQNDTNEYCAALGFGDIKTLKSGDAYHTICAASTTSANTSNPAILGVYGSNATLTAAAAGLYLPRSYTQTGTAINAAAFVDMVAHTANNSGPGANTNLPLPNGPDAAAYLSPRHIVETSGPHYRGTMPGLWHPAHSRAQLGAANGDTISGGSGQLSGKTFEAILVGSAGVVFMETTDTWDT